MTSGALMGAQINVITQWAANTATTSGFLILFCSGLYLTYTTRRFVSFALTIPFTVCPYLLSSAAAIDAMPFPLALVGSILVSGFAVLALDWIVNAHLAKRQASALTFMVVSLALSIAAQNLVSLVWGDEGRLIGRATVRAGSLVFGARITVVQALAIAAGACVAASMLLALNRTRVGRELRALGNDPVLARCVGLNGTVLCLQGAFLSGCLAGGAGVLVGYDSALSPTFGLPILFLSVVASVMGGMSSFGSVICGCLLVASMQQVMVIAIGGRWYELILFVAFVLCLVIRPRGVWASHQNR